MRIKLLHSLRRESRIRIGVFLNDSSTFDIVFDKDYFLPDLTRFNPKKEQYVVIENDIVSLEEAKRNCNYYRNCFIEKKVEKMRENNPKRFY